MSAEVTKQPDRRIIVLFPLAVIVATGAAFLAAQQMQIENAHLNEVLRMLEPANAVLPPQERLTWGTTGTYCTLGGMFTIASIETAGILLLPQLLAVAVTPLLIFATLPLHWSYVHYLHVRPHPFAFGFAIIGGLLVGLALRERRERLVQIDRQTVELQDKRKELLETRLTLLQQDEIERRILAADLHDQVLNDLKQIAQRFQRYTTQPDEQDERAIRSLTGQVMREIREVMETLSPSVLEHLGLPAAVEDCLNRGAERSGFKVRFKSEIGIEDLATLSLVEQGLLYRLSQESVTNICKHAGAATVSAFLRKDGNELVIRILDDGKGIDPAQINGDSRGMKYQRYRARLIGATINWKVGDNGKGTVVEIRLNLSERRSMSARGA